MHLLGFKHGNTWANRWHNEQNIHSFISQSNSYRQIGQIIIFISHVQFLWSSFSYHNYNKVSLFVFPQNHIISFPLFFFEVFKFLILSLFKWTKLSKSEVKVTTVKKHRFEFIFLAAYPLFGYYGDVFPKHTPRSVHRSKNQPVWPEVS